MKLRYTFLSFILTIGLGQPVLAADSAKPAAEPTHDELMRGFKGKIEVDVRDSKPDWTPFIPKKAAKGSPNILMILYDDTGQAAWSPYGGRIQMPTLDKLAADGLTYTQWHTTALCSPTRSTMQTGRTHSMNGFANISEGSEGFPGYSTRFPDQVTTVAEVLQQNGYATFWLGKDHNVPEPDVAPGAYRGEWPLQKGWDRFYGFLGGETNLRRTSRIRRSRCSKTRTPPTRPSRSSCGSTPAPTMRRTRLPRNGSRNTRANSMTVTMPIAYG
jgi:hypothetical protein